MKPPIAEVLEHYGATFVPEADRFRKMRCPFHEDRNASATVNTEAGRFRCFACDVNGDAYDVIAWKEGTRYFPDTKRLLESILGRSLNDLSPTNEEGQSRRRVPFEDSRPQRGQRSVFSTRIRRKPFAGA